MENTLEDVINEITKSELETIQTNKSRFIEQLSQKISDLLTLDVTKLLNTLYRLDVSEEKVYDAMKKNDRQEVANLLSYLIIDREIEKSNSRKSNSSSS